MLIFRMYVVDMWDPRPGLGGAVGVRQNPVHELRRVQTKVRYQSVYRSLRWENAQIRATEIITTVILV